MKKIIFSEKAPKAIGPYSQAVEMNGMLFISGQIPINPLTGMIPEGIEAQTEQVMQNIADILEAAGYSFKHVVIYLSIERHEQFQGYERCLWNIIVKIRRHEPPLQ